MERNEVPVLGQGIGADTKFPGARVKVWVMNGLKDKLNGCSGEVKTSRTIGRVAAIAVMSAVLPVSALALSLEEAVKLAVDSHPVVLGAKAGQSVASQEVEQVRASFFPSIDSRVAGGFDHFNNQTTRFRRTRGSQESSNRNFHQDASVTVQQMLFDGYETQNLLDAAKARYMVSGHQVDDAEEAIALRAIEAFFEVQRSREVVALAEENVQTHIEVVDDVSLRAEQGAGNQADVLQAESRLSLAEARLIEQQGLLRDAEADFLEAVGVMPDELVVGDKPEHALPASVEDAVIRGIAANPAVLAANRAIESRRSDAEAAEALFVPRFDLELSANAEKNVDGARSSGASLSALVVMRFNWYRGGGDTARLRGARELLNQQRMEELETKRLIEEQVRVDWTRLITAEDRLPNLDERVVAAAQVVSAYRQQFELGQRTLLDVLDTENELFEARAELVEGEYAVHFAQWALLASLGEVLSTMGIASMAPADLDTMSADPPLLFLGNE